jgi:cytosine/adenosine deaminase-related metal-dependent hydrolase
MRLASYLQRRPGPIDDPRLPSLALLGSAARHGAQALGQGDRIGSLGVGKEADLLVIDRSRLAWPQERYAATPIADVVLDRAKAADIVHVMIAGRTVLRDGVITTVNESKVRESYAEMVRRNWEHRQDIAGSRQLALDVDPYVLDFYRSWPEVTTAPAYAYNIQSAPAFGSESTL